MKCMTRGCNNERIQDSGWCADCLNARWANRTITPPKTSDELERDGYDADLTGWLAQAKP